MKHREIEVEGQTVMGLELPLGPAPLVLAYGKNGFVMCGYLNIEAAEKLGTAAVRVRGVSTVEDLLKAKVDSMTTAAANKGVTTNMTGKEALLRVL